jgi:hypothetical protein
VSVDVISWVWRSSAATGTDRLVLLAIADAADSDGTNAWPSVATLARKAAVSNRTVQRSIGNLVELGELEVLEQAGGPARMRADRRPNEYRVLMQRRGDTPVAPSEPRGDSGGADGVTSVALRGDTGVTQPVHDPSVGPVQRTPPTPPQAGGDVEVVFAAWCASTGRERSILTDKRRRLIRDRLREGYAVEELVAACAGWRLSKWHAGENPGNVTYNDIELLLRDARHVEKFRDLALDYIAGGEAGSREPAAVRALRTQGRQDEADARMRVLEHYARRSEERTRGRVLDAASRG